MMRRSRALKRKGNEDSMLSSTKDGEMRRTAEMLVQIAERGTGVYFVIAFLIDCNRLSAGDLKRQLEILKDTKGAIR